VQDRRYVSFMYSYPNLIPLPAGTVRRIADAVAPYAFDRLYGAWWGRVVQEDAQAAVARSAARYIAALGGDGWPLRSRGSPTSSHAHGGRTATRAPRAARPSK
jgi:hypothetical protein